MSRLTRNTIRWRTSRKIDGNHEPYILFKGTRLNSLLCQEPIAFIRDIKDRYFVPINFQIRKGIAYLLIDPNFQFFPGWHM